MPTAIARVRLPGPTCATSFSRRPKYVGRRASCSGSTAPLFSIDQPPWGQAPRMLSDEDIALVAHLMIRKYGADAWQCAQTRAAELARSGSGDAASLWLEIGEWVRQIQQEE